MLDSLFIVGLIFELALSFCDVASSGERERWVYFNVCILAVHVGV